MDKPVSLSPTHGVETALRVLGGKWKMMIIWHLRDVTHRYGELRRLLPDITEKMLIRQLRELEHDGIITRTDFQEIPPHVEYTVTAHGGTLYPVLDALCQWGWVHVRFAGEESTVTQ